MDPGFTCAVRSGILVTTREGCRDGGACCQALRGSCFGGEPSCAGDAPKVGIALATLALEPSREVQVATLVRAVYGTHYGPSVHRDMLKTLLSRGRKALGDAGTISRAGDRVSLDLESAMRCTTRAASVPSKIASCKRSPVTAT